VVEQWDSSQSEADDQRVSFDPDSIQSKNQQQVFKKRELKKVAKTKEEYEESKFKDSSRAPIKKGLPYELPKMHVSGKLLKPYSHSNYYQKYKEKKVAIMKEHPREVEQEFLKEDSQKGKVHSNMFVFIHIFW